MQGDKEKMKRNTCVVFYRMQTKLLYREVNLRNKYTKESLVLLLHIADAQGLETVLLLYVLLQT